MGDVINQFFQMLQQVILPNWPDLIPLLPWVLVAFVIVALAGLAWVWVGTMGRNRSRVPKPLAGGAPPPGVHLPGPSRWPFVAPIGAALLLFSIVLPPKNAAGDTIGLFNFWLFLLGIVVTLIAIIGWLRDAGREWRATDHPAEAHAAALPAGTSAAIALAPGMVMHRPRPGAFEAAERVAQAPPKPVEPPPGVHLPGPSPWPLFGPIGATVMLYGIIFSGALVVGGLILTLIAILGWYLDAGHEYFTTEEFGHAVPATRDPVKVWPRRLVPVYGAVILFSFLIALAPIGMSALNGLTPAKASPTPVAVPAEPKLEAQGVKFLSSTLVVPAGRPFNLIFNNNDAGVPHNVQIDSSDKSQTFFDGQIVTGVTTVSYNVPALQPGTYYFLCKVHPTMNGTLTAVTEPGAPGGAPAGSGAPNAAPAPSQAP